MTSFSAIITMIMIIIIMMRKYLTEPDIQSSSEFTLVHRQQLENIWMRPNEATELRGSWLLWPGSGRGRISSLSHHYEKARLMCVCVWSLSRELNSCTFLTAPYHKIPHTHIYHTYIFMFTFPLFLFFFPVTKRVKKWIAIIPAICQKCAKGEEKKEISAGR